MDSEKMSKWPPSWLPKIMQRMLVDPPVHRLRLKANHTRRVPMIMQMSQTECGAACLAMILNYYKRPTAISEVRDNCGVGRDGLSAQTIARAARGYGLQVRAYSIKNLADFSQVPLPVIVHWSFNHYVVVERRLKDKYAILDPARGKHLVSEAEFSKYFTGVTLTFEPTSGFSQRTQSFDKPFWREYFGQLSKGLGLHQFAFQIIGASLLLQVIGLVLPLLTQFLVDHVFPQRMDGVMPVLGVGIFLMASTQAIAFFLRAELLIYLQSKFDSRIMIGFFSHILKLPFRYFQQRTSGDLLTRLGSNYIIRDVLTSHSLSALLDGTFVLAYLGIIFWRDIWFGLITLSFVTLQVITLMLTSRRIHYLALRELEAQSVSQSYLVEAIKGIAYLKAAGAEASALMKWSNKFYTQFNITIQRNQLMAIIGTTQATLRIFYPLALLWFGMIQVLNGSISLGLMLALSSIANLLLNPIGSLVNSGQQFQLAGANLERIADVIRTQPEQVSPDAIKHSPAGHIELRQVSFKYGPEAANALQDVSLTIPIGKKVALVGATGSGKTTLAMLLLGFYQPDQGEILYDGIRLQSIDFPYLRKQIGVVLQEPYLFSGSIRQNISFNNPDATLEQIKKAAQLAAMDDDILKMPMGYETMISEGGTTLSGGQRQRLSLARALLNMPKILILDEATSHLDILTEEKIDTNLSSLSCTRVVIAHRLSTISNADLICVMDQGKIVETGSHKELLAKQGIYAMLIQSQLNASFPKN